MRRWMISTKWMNSAPSSLWTPYHVTMSFLHPTWYCKISSLHTWRWFRMACSSRPAVSAAWSFGKSKERSRGHMIFMPIMPEVGSARVRSLPLITSLKAVSLEINYIPAGNFLAVQGYLAVKQRIAGQKWSVCSSEKTKWIMKQNVMANQPSSYTKSKIWLHAPCIVFWYPVSWKHTTIFRYSI